MTALNEKYIDFPRILNRFHIASLKYCRESLMCMFATSYYEHDIISKNDILMHI